MPQVLRLFVFAVVALLLQPGTPCFAQQTTEQDPETTGGQQTTNPQAPAPSQQTPAQQTTQQQTAGQQAEKQINVNWLYGSFVPKDVPLEPLTPPQRFQLYLHQTYITYGIYIKTVFFALEGQIKGTPPEWEGASGFGKRALSYQGQFIIQNTISSAGNAYVGWEPRYERCRCDGIKSRTWHAIKRNFVTYNSTDSSLRPQIMPYLGAAGGAAIASVAWLPGSQQPGTKAYQAAITQIFVGVTVNLVAEYAPEWTRLIRRDKKKNAGTPNQH